MLSTFKQASNILNYFGIENQQGKAIEECEELIKAIKEGNTENIIEEMADVTIMLMQLSQHYKCNMQMEQVIERKLKRTTERIQTNYYRVGGSDEIL